MPAFPGPALVMGVIMLVMTDARPHRRAVRVRRAADKVSSQPTPGPHVDSVLAAEEYQTLRAEIIARIQKQQDIMNFAILVMTALLTYAGFTRSGAVTLSHAVGILGAPASHISTGPAVVSIEPRDAYRGRVKQQ